MNEFRFICARLILYERHKFLEISFKGFFSMLLFLDRNLGLSLVVEGIQTKAENEATSFLGNLRVQGGVEH